MTMKKRTFTKEEKLNIIKEASEKGITETLEKYGVYKASYYDWKNYHCGITVFSLTWYIKRKMAEFI